MTDAAKDTTTVTQRDEGLVAAVLEAEAGEGRVLGWAPGNYFNKCMHCEKQFTGDKRAVECLPCVQRAIYKHAAPALARRVQSLTADLDAMRAERDATEVVLVQLFDGITARGVDHAPTPTPEGADIIAAARSRQTKEPT